MSFPARQGHARPVCSLLTDDHTGHPPFLEPSFLSGGSRSRARQFVTIPATQFVAIVDRRASTARIAHRAEYAALIHPEPSPGALDVRLYRIQSDQRSRKSRRAITAKAAHSRITRIAILIIVISRLIILASWTARAAQETSRSGRRHPVEKQLRPDLRPRAFLGLGCARQIGHSTVTDWRVRFRRGESGLGVRCFRARRLFRVRATR